MLLAVLAPLLAIRMVSTTCESSIPSNIAAGIFQSQVIELLQQSQTFREQCRRVAAARVLRVALHVSTELEVGARGQTTIYRYDTGAIRASVVLRFAEDYSELLAHEFEHILEQLDGVDLSAEAASGKAWRIAGGAFETRRALNAGVHARQEVDETAEPAHADGVKAPSLRHPFD